MGASVAADVGAVAVVCPASSARHFPPRNSGHLRSARARLQARVPFCQLAGHSSLGWPAAAAGVPATAAAAAPSAPATTAVSHRRRDTRRPPQGHSLVNLSMELLPFCHSMEHILCQMAVPPVNAPQRVADGADFPESGRCETNDEATNLGLGFAAKPAPSVAKGARAIHAPGLSGLSASAAASRTPAPYGSVRAAGVGDYEIL